MKREIKFYFNLYKYSLYIKIKSIFELQEEHFEIENKKITIRLNAYLKEIVSTVFNNSFHYYVNK